LKRDLSAAAFFVALAVAMTWPLVRVITRGVAYPGDPFHLTWVLDWDWYATLHQPLHLFQANIFYPTRDALAYSEHLYGIAIFLFPLRAIGVGALAAHNIAVLIAFAFSGFGAYLLGRAVTGNTLAGLVAGIFYAYLPWRFIQLPHLQSLWAGWIPLLLLALIHCGRKTGWRSALLFGGAFLMNGLSNLHYFAFGSIAAMLSVPIVIVDRRQWMRIAGATAIACALLTPFLAPYARVGHKAGMQRTWTEVKGWSARPGDWVNPTSRLYRRWFDPRPDPELWLFPGFLGIAVAGAGIVAGRHDRKMLALALLWTGIGFTGSLGVHTFFHRFLFGYVPGFRSIRVPARWAIDAYLGMSMLIAFAASWLTTRWKFAGVGLAVIFLIELDSAPVRYFCTNPDVPAIYRWLRAQKGPIVELPMDAAHAYSYLRFATEHHLPTVNGLSSFVPPRIFELEEKWSDPARRAELLDQLQAMGVRLVIVHGDAVPPPEREWLRRALDAGRLSFVRRFDDGISGDWVFAFTGSQLRDVQLERFLRGEYTYNEATFGVLDYPRPDEYVRGNALFSGWALSPYGIREVNLLFEDGGVRIPTTLRAEPSLTSSLPWYDATRQPRFLASFNRRPRGVYRDTDVQVEIIDGRGQRTLLEGRWFTWER
jgi:hypothetical protein